MKIHCDVFKSNYSICHLNQTKKSVKNSIKARQQVQLLTCLASNDRNMLIRKRRLIQRVSTDTVVEVKYIRFYALEHNQGSAAPLIKEHQRTDGGYKHRQCRNVLLSTTLPPINQLTPVEDTAETRPTILAFKWCHCLEK